MSISINIYNEINELFKYANSSNFFHIIEHWMNGDEERVFKVFQNCISCGIQRFTDQQMINANDLSGGISGYFCDSCHSNRLLEIITNYKPTNQFEMIADLISDNLFGLGSICPSIQNISNYFFQVTTCALPA